jgi:hypothetical protein
MVDTEGTRDEISFLLSITGNMAGICARSLQEIQLADSDLPIAALIIKYATEIDEGNLATLARLGPSLLSCMESLQMSPRSRAQANKGAKNDQPIPTSKLDELRIKREERKNRASDIHTATS